MLKFSQILEAASDDPSTDSDLKQNVRLRGASVCSHKCHQGKNASETVQIAASTEEAVSREFMTEYSDSETIKQGKKGRTDWNFQITSMWFPRDIDSVAAYVMSKKTKSRVLAKKAHLMNAHKSTKARFVFH